jgi:hypothetical protein
MKRFTIKNGCRNHLNDSSGVGCCHTLEQWVHLSLFFSDKNVKFVDFLQNQYKFFFFFFFS